MHATPNIFKESCQSEPVCLAESYVQVACQHGIKRRNIKLLAYKYIYSFKVSHWSIQY